MYGMLKVIDKEELAFSLRKLVDKLSASTLKQMDGIVGFKIEIKEIQAAFKLSQNRNDEDHQNIIKKLENSKKYDDQEVAKRMNK